MQPVQCIGRLEVPLLRCICWVFNKLRLVQGLSDYDPALFYIGSADNKALICLPTSDLAGFIYVVPVALANPLYSTMRRLRYPIPVKTPEDGE